MAKKDTKKHDIKLTNNADKVDNPTENKDVVKIIQFIISGKSMRRNSWNFSDTFEDYALYNTVLMEDLIGNYKRAGISKENVLKMIDEVYDKSIVEPEQDGKEGK